MRLLVMRHGESEADRLDVHEGRADFELTERGHVQAQAMTCFIHKHYTVSAIYCSPLKRAKQTAMYLSQWTGIALEEDKNLMEFNNGLIAGLPRDVAREKYPYIKNLPIHQAVYEQESKLQFRYRAEEVLSRVLWEHEMDETVVLVSHGGMINQLYHAFMRLPIESDIHVVTGDAGMHEWLITDEKRLIVQANKTLHTEEEE